MSIFVPILYGERDFDAFDDVGDFVKSALSRNLKEAKRAWIS
jgi:hypothetical protein